MKQPLEIIKLLKENYPNAKYYLNFSNPVELLVAAILSAQCRDEVVNATTEKLFKKYKSADNFANADVNNLVKDIENITFAGNKAKNIISSCKVLVENYNSEVPKTIDELTSLPGIGNKTANVILANAFDIIEGIVVDVHTIRITYRLGWTKNKNPDKIEKDLMKFIPKNNWKELQWLIKAHGRKICKAPIPYCSKCFLFNLCQKNGVTEKN